MYAQGGRASITGTITDSTGAVVPGAIVTATNTGTSFAGSATTTDIGSFNIPLLPVGTYDVSVKKEGFRTETRSGIVLTADQIATLNLVMSVGATTDEVRVT